MTDSANVGDEAPAIRLSSDGVKLKPASVRAAAPRPVSARPMSEIRRPVAPAPRPAPVPAKAAAPPAAPVGDDDDPEQLLKQYTERQKNKVARLERQVAELQKVVAERDAYKAKCHAFAQELTETKKRLEAAATQDEVVKDLQSQVDAAIHSNNMLTEEKAKHDSTMEDLESKIIMLEERGKQANQALMAAHKFLVAQRDIVKDADTRVVSAIQMIQGTSKSKGQES